ncbi:MAG: hypothetical protein WKG00_18740 [Polyangiaceae bacterium]
MKTRFVIVPLAFAALLALAACDEQKPADPATPAPAAEVKLTDADLPVAADFEEDAEKTITMATYKAELETLTKEVEGS